MSEQTKKNWFKKHPVWSVLIGLFILFMLIGIFAESPEEKQANQNKAISQNEVVAKNENIGKIVKLNSCELEPENADYWQGKEVNVWNSAKRDSVSFKLPACDNIELEIIEYTNEDGNELFKVKSDNQEGWISKIQLMK